MRALVVLILLAGVSDGQELKALARQKFDQAQSEFGAGHYEKALALFRDSYQLAPYPDLLFNIGRCYEAMHDYRDALDAYERYLVVNPTDEDAQRRAAEMRQRAENEPPPSPTPTAPPVTKAEPLVVASTTPPPVPVYKKWWLWTAVVGVAAVALGVGLGVGLSQPNPQRTFPPVGQ